MKYLYLIFSLFFFSFIKAESIHRTTIPENNNTNKIIANTASNSRPEKSEFRKKLDKFNKTMEKAVKKFPLPVISYSTTTKWLFGLTKINSFRIGAEKPDDTTIQPSHITELAYFTQNKQYKIVVSANLMFGDNKYESISKLMVINFPTLFFGVGNNTEAEKRCILDTRNVATSQVFMYNFSERFYFGLKYDFNYYWKVDTLDYRCSLSENQVTGLRENEGFQSGLGMSISRETRDNRFNARRGSYINIGYMGYFKWLGSNFVYNSFTLDLRKYVTPVKWLTIAGQFYTEAKYGDVPVQSLALMGGANHMRGVYIGRFRDKTKIEAQLEMRFPIVWILGGTVFTGLGQVGPDYQSYSLKGTKWSYGAGLRLMVDQSTRTNMRFDLGFFEGSPQFFFTFSEAF